ncbi:MAG: hypothetical protein QOG58_1914, partial [Caballeronia sp.]|nr:hypothetical protein [Caballeronia sp.]
MLQYDMPSHVTPGNVTGLLLNESNGR